MIKKYTLSVLFLLSIVYTGLAQTISKLSSPDGSIQIAIQPGNSLNSLLSYHLLYQKQSVLKEGALGLEMTDNSLAGTWKVISKKLQSNNTTWKPVYGERNQITDHYNALTLTFANNTARIVVDFRVYNEGIAYKYAVLKQNTSLTLTAEKSAFVFAANDTAWVSARAQALYKAKPINEIKEEAERPLTVKISDKLYVALGEAALVDFARMKFINTEPLTVSSILSSPVVQNSKLESPWRYIIIGRSPGDLLEKNYLSLNLNQPSKISDTKWIKPGKVIREISLTTTGALATVDFAARHHLSYILFDAGWYGKEGADSSDATRVMVDPARSKGPLDLHRVITYGKSKNIGVILYVNRQAAERQLDTILPLYQKWGIKGVKFGFVQVGSQKWTSWLHSAVRKAAKYKLMVDVHDEYRPTGYTRTYPNFMTQEGIRGDEESPTNEHSLITLFTRMIAGAADNTNCYFDVRVNKMGSHASQLAKSVCLYSPFQFLYWYDAPATANSKPDDNRVISEVPELTFFDHLPTVWDDTKVLEGEIGKYATVARKKNGEWYIGSLVGENDRDVTVKFNFLEKGKKYTAYIFTDDAASTTRTKVKIETKTITSNSLLNIHINRNNGMAMRIVPVKS